MSGNPAVRDAAAAPAEVVITRVFDAPRVLVFEAWSSYAHLARWWGPMGFSTPQGDVDLRPGGPFTLLMRGPDGTEYPMAGVVHEVDAPNRIVWSAVVHDETKVDTVVTFEDEGGKTRLTVRQTVPADPAMAGGQKQGWSQSLERLAAALPASNAALALGGPDADREVTMVRLLDAPRDLVWKVWSDPKHLVNWWGPNGFTITTKTFDQRPGGEWDFVMHGPDGTNFRNHLAYTVVEAPSRLEWEHGPAPKFHVVATLRAEGECTRVTMTMRFATAEERDRTVKTFGALEGGRQTMDRLETLVASLSGAPELVLARTLDAPRARVWQAWTDPAHLAAWWGPKGFAWAGGTLDLRPGGIFHYGMKTPDGARTMWGRFLYREVVPPSRLVFVVSFSDANGAVTRAPMPDWPLEVLNVLTLEDENGKTRLTLRGWPVHATEAEKKAFDAGRRSMEQGFAGTFAQLEEFLAKGAA